jgi:cell division protein FtsB
MRHFPRKTAPRRLGRLLQALAPDIEEPAVVGAADATVFDIAVLQRTSAMGAVPAQQADLAVLVAEQNQLFAQDRNRLRYVAQLSDRADDQPVAAQPVSRRSAAADAAQVLQ